MRFIERLTKPAILEEKADQWRDAFVSSGKKRPDNSKYAHSQIRESLNTMSFCKCFYCERKLKDIPQEVDHFIEVAERKDLAYEWDNLYLACDNCNNKQPNRSIPVAEAINPCHHSDEEIQQHLAFEGEIIRARNNSDLGRRTIQKYRLDSPQQDHVRLKAIKRFQTILIEILKNTNRDKRDINTQEKETLLAFGQKDRSFSLMFTVLLERHQIT